jgi:hypothetical protein
MKAMFFVAQPYLSARLVVCSFVFELPGFWPLVWRLVSGNAVRMKTNNHRLEAGGSKPFAGAIKKSPSAFLRVDIFL